MKKLIFAMVLFLVSMTFGQTFGEWVAEGDTLGNSQSRYYYIYFESEPTRHLDSVAFQVIAKGEIDIDAFTVTKGTDLYGTFYSLASDSSATMTINNADGTTSGALVTATSVATDALEGITALKITIPGAASGNDGTDPNAIYFRPLFYYTR